jgi:hypothetical protein
MLVDVIKGVKEKRSADFVEEILGGEGRKREKPPLKADDWIRVHDFGRMCPREEAICSILGVTRYRIDLPKMLFTFNMGSSLGDMFRDEWLGPKGYLIGSWMCKNCGKGFGKVYQSDYNRLKGNGYRVKFPQKCDQCGLDRFSYTEEMVCNQDYRIAGHPDTFLIFNNENFVGEIKTARSLGYNKLMKSPKKEGSVDNTYLIQLKIYLWITGYSKGKMIYINKDATPFKGFDNYLWMIDVCHNDKFIDNRVKRWIDSLRKSIRSGVVPGREICTSRSDARAKDCNVAEDCFSKRFK